MPSRPNASAVSRFQLVIDGEQVGFVKSVDGGLVRAAVVPEIVGSNYFVKKHIGQPTYEPVSAQLDLPMAKAIHEWISTQWNGDFKRRNVSLIECDYNFVARAEREFLNAWISEVTIPPMDAAAKDGGCLTVRFTPESISRKPTSARNLSGTLGKSKQKGWLRSHFRLEIDGLNCRNIIKVESFTVKQPIQESAVGETRTREQRPGPIDFPNLSVTFSEASAKSWVTWFEDFVIKGNCADENEKSGSLVLLAQNLRDELGRVNFHNVGIVCLAENQPMAQDRIRTMTAELYCDRMEFVAKQ